MPPAERLRAAAFDGFRTNERGEYDLGYSAAVIDRALNYTELCEAAAAMLREEDSHAAFRRACRERLRRALEDPK